MSIFDQRFSLLPSRSFLIIELKLHLWLEGLQLRPPSRHSRAMSREARAFGREPWLIYKDISLMFLFPASTMSLSTCRSFPISFFLFFFFC